MVVDCFRSMKYRTISRPCSPDDDRFIITELKLIVRGLVLQINLGWEYRWKTIVDPHLVCEPEPLWEDWREFLAEVALCELPEIWLLKQRDVLFRFSQRRVLSIPLMCLSSYTWDLASNLVPGNFGSSLWCDLEAQIASPHKQLDLVTGLWESANKA